VAAGWGGASLDELLASGVAQPTKVGSQPSWAAKQAGQPTKLGGLKVKAVVFDTFGDPDVLHVAEVPVPEPGPGQMRIRVRAAGVNPVDSEIRSGAMQAVFPTPLPAILGIDVAGIIDAVGSDVDGLPTGESVVGWADAPAGAYAEYALVSQVVRKPADLPFADAVTLPTAVEAANRGLNQLGLKAGETVLIHGAAGSVGTIAAQLAVARGATVVGTASEAHQDYVRSLGAIPTRYGDGLVGRVRAIVPNVDAVLDAAGKGALPDSITLRGGTDRILTLADPEGPSLGVTFSAGTRADRSISDLAAGVDMAARGELTTTVGGTYPLAQAAEAQRVSQGGHPPGKLVLTIG
jgi:NADPH:quinone reductase-like Zn-dependent oxidoreductase